MRLKVEKTLAWQVEGPGGSYCCTTYSKHDALLCRGLAKGIPRLKCLKEARGEKQPRGIYIYLKDPKTGKEYPELEVYDRRLASLIRENIQRFKGDF